jgi:hypothetical protein
VNLLYDAARKSIEFATRIADAGGLSGWRKSAYWIKQFKANCRHLGKLSSSGGKNKEKRILESTKTYLKLAMQLSQKLDATEAKFKNLTEISLEMSALFEGLNYFKMHLDKHIDLITRRIIDAETIPHSEKVFSLFEPHTEWIKKGKAGNRPELGLRIAIATDQSGFILISRVMLKEHDKDIAVPMVKELLQSYDVQSVSFDKNFWTPENNKKLSKLVSDLVLPKKGRLNRQEYEREHSKSFLALRKQHSAVESAINCLEHHGLNRCPDKGLNHFRKYTAIGVLACNLHKLGNILQQNERNMTKNRPLKKAA